MEGLYDLLAQRHVHFFTLAKSARVGGTLFAICWLLHKIGTSGGPVLWVDPSRASARQFFRRELEPYLLACPPVADQALRDKEHWTASQCFFRGGAFLKIAGAGSPTELAGFQSEVIIINEGDKIHHTAKGEAPAHELAIVRSKQFRFTRKIIENSTPTDEFGPTWRRFLKGSQHYCYLPCPHCSKPTRNFKPPKQVEPGRSPLSYDPRLRGWQRLSFFPEERDVSFDENFNSLPKGETRLEKTGKFKFDHCRLTERREVEPGKWEDVEVGWDYDRVELETRYECAHCGKEIDQSNLGWMLRRYRWVAHNRKAVRAHISAHWWAAYSPFEAWGETAKKFLLACGDGGALHDFFNSDLGLPFKAAPTEVDEDDITRLQKASPHYLLRTLPFEPVMLTMTCDVQLQGGANPFWWMVVAWGIAWDQPGWPTIAAVIDYGPAVSREQLEEIAGIRADVHGRFNEYTWKDPNTGETEKFRVIAGLIDSGDQAQSEANIYDFCLRNQHVFSPSKGGSRAHLRGNILRPAPVYDNQLELIWYWSDYFAQTLYRRVIKDRTIPRYLPADLGQEFFDQLTDEYTAQENGRMVWKTRRKNNHLGDCWKLQEVMSGSIEERLDELRVERMALEEKKAEPVPTA